MKRLLPLAVVALVTGVAEAQALDGLCGGAVAAGLSDASVAGEEFSWPTAVFFEGGGPTGLEFGRVIYSPANTLLPDDLFRALREEGAEMGTGVGSDSVPQLPGDRVMGGGGPAGGESAVDGVRGIARSIPEPAVALIGALGFLALLRRRPAA